MLEEGDLCAKIIEMVLPVYNLYSKGRISFEEYKERVDLLMRKEAEDSAVKEVSFENDLPLNAEKSETVEKFEDCYEKSSLSDLHSNPKRSELSLKSSHAPIREEPSKYEQSESKVSMRKESQANNDSVSFREKEKEDSNISFKEESVASSHSNLKKISEKEKESVRSESFLEEDSFQKKNSFGKRQSELNPQEQEPSSYQEFEEPSVNGSKSIQKEEASPSIRSSRSNHSNRSGRSDRSNRRLIERRNQSPAQQRSKISN